MNWFLIIAGFVTFGHFVFGINWYLKPMLNSHMDEIPKKTMQAVFHYVSVYLILSTVALSGIGFNLLQASSPSLLVQFISLNYFFFAIWQIGLALTSKIPGALVKMFQWSMFLPIAVLAWLGA